MKKKLFLILTLVWMVVIFSFSAQNASVSTEESNTIGLMIGRLFIYGFKDWNVAKQIAFAKSIDFIVRKCAHAMEYSVLGMLLFGALKENEIYARRKALILRCGYAVIIACGYAITDEIHQLFVPGRACRSMDVCIDTAGAFAGVLIVILIRFVLKNKRNRMLRKLEIKSEGK